MIGHQAGMGSVGIMNVSLGIEDGMNVSMKSRAGEGERPLTAIAREGGAENIPVVMMRMIMVGEDLVGRVDTQVFIQMTKATAEREQNLTKGGKKGMGERNVGLQILMILKKMILVDLKVTLRVSHTVVIIQILRTPGVIAGVGEVGEGSVPVLVLPNSQMHLGHLRETVVCQQTNESKLSKRR